MLGDVGMTGNYNARLTLGNGPFLNALKQKANRLERHVAISVGITGIE